MELALPAMVPSASHHAVADVTCLAVHHDLGAGIARAVLGIADDVDPVSTLCGVDQFNGAGMKVNVVTDHLAADSGVGQYRAENAGLSESFLMLVRLVSI